MMNQRLNIDKTIALLVGIETYEDEELHDLPAALENVNTLRRILWSPTFGIPKGQVKREIDLNNKSEFEDKIYDIIEQSDVETLIIYYAGHGILDDNDNFFLSFSDTKVNRLRAHGLRIRNLSEILEDNHLNVILILDCCFSEKAIEEFEQRNCYVITSSALNRTSKYPLNEEHSAFTKELIYLLEEGIDNNQPFLTLDNIFDALKLRLESKSLPSPKRASRNEVGEMLFAKNNFDISRRLKKDDKEYLQRIYDALVVFDPGLITKYQELSPRSPTYLKEFKKLILEAYPSVISYQLKNLMPDEPKVDIAFLKRFFEQTIQYIAFILLMDNQQKDEKHKEVGNIGHWIAPNHHFYRDFVQRILQTDATYFIKEFASQKTGILTAIREFEANAYQDGIDYEIVKEKLINLIASLACLTNYRLASLRFIDIGKRIAPPDKFKHELSILHGESPKDYKRLITFSQGYFHSNAVVLFQTKDLSTIQSDATYLYLWPLVIDMNSFSPEGHTPELHFYAKKEEGCYWYKEVNLWKDIELRKYQSIDKTLTTEELRSQFEAFEGKFRIAKKNKFRFSSKI